VSAGLAAVLRALVGGFFTLAGALDVELRRDRRHHLGAARLVIAELRRSSRTAVVATDRPVGDWYEGPFPAISAAAWSRYAADFVGRLNANDAAEVDGVATEIRAAGELGFYSKEANELPARVEKAAEILERFAKPSWFDRHIWRL